MKIQEIRSEVTSQEYHIQELVSGNYELDSDNPFGCNYLLWCFEKNIAYRVGVPNCRNTPGAYFEAAEGRDVWEVIKTQTAWLSDDRRSRFTKSKMKPGTYYKRMARPYSAHPKDLSGVFPLSTADDIAIAVSISQLMTLTSQLQNICQTVHPDTTNFKAFGHNIRNFLILACTEVEAQWSGILRANSYDKNNMNTNQYVKLAEPMRLREFEVRFPMFPWLQPIKPFSVWGITGKPTSELPWYTAYNAVKHNRELEFNCATLEHAFQAAAACYIMLIAQFGVSFRGPYDHSDLNFFELAARPVWPLEDVCLMPNAYPISGNANTDWRAVEYPF